MSHAGLGNFMQTQRENQSLLELELAYAMNDIVNMKGEVATETGRPTLAFRIKCLLERPV